jgi:hypothetical protein
MSIDSKVKWFDNTMASVPRPGTGVAGSMVTFLDAVLVDGFGTVTVDSLVVSGGIATVTRSVGHGFVDHQVIEIAGASPSSLNGQWRVRPAPTGTTFTFACPGISDQVASGTITCKTAALGWERVYTGTNKRVYRSPETTECARSYFRFDDSWANAGYNGPKLAGYQYMSDVDTGTGQWDWGDSGAANCFASSESGYAWFFVGDTKTCYIVLRSKNTPAQFLPMAFGAFQSFKANDANNDLIVTNQNNSYNGACIPRLLEAYQYWTTNQMLYCTSMRNRADLGGPCYWTGCRWVNGHSGYGGPAHPEPFMNGLWATPALIREVGNNGDPIRGLLRGQYWVLMNQPFSCEPPGINLDDVVGLEGRRCRLIRLQQPTSTQTAGGVACRMLVDITGPWN